MNCYLAESWWELFSKELSFVSVAIYTVPFVCSEIEEVEQKPSRNEGKLLTSFKLCVDEINAV